MKLFIQHKNLLAIFIAIGSIGSLNLSSRADDWPQWRGPQRNGTWEETGIVEKLPP
ncbi:MAG: hypothetical protein RLZZ396_1919, partial [Planctomycetota bacterium]